MLGGGGRILSDDIDDFPPGILPAIDVATIAYIETHRAAIDGVHAALAEGLAWHQAHPDVSPQQIQFWTELMTEQKILTEPVDVKALLVR